MNAITIQMTSQDAERLVVTSMAWGPSWVKHEKRFELIKTERKTYSYRWGNAFWLEDGAAAYILFTSYLTAHGLQHEVLWDTAEHGGYVVLTDWIGE